MAERVEIPVNEDGPLSEQDVQNLEQEAASEGQEEQTHEERPEWLPEKFETAEEMAKAYAELQSEFTKKQQASESGNQETEEAAGNAQEMSLESFQDFTKEFNETGDVSEESRQNIVDTMGLPREMVDGYIDGQRAIMDSHFAAIYGEVGGEEKYGEMISWAVENLPEGEQQAFNDAVMNGTTDQMNFAVKSLAARWMSNGGGSSPAPLIQGSTSAEGSSGSFRSVAELTRAMKDPRYTKDKAYRKDIETRLSNSNIL